MRSYNNRIVTGLFVLLTALFASTGTAEQSLLVKLKSNPAQNSFKVVDSYITDGTQQIIYIEDIHSHYSAQKNIASIIATLNNNSIPILTEGSSGDILTQFYSTFPIPKTRNNVADKLLHKGLISGEEYFCITNGIALKIHGIDDPDLYKINRDIFKTALSHRKKTDQILSKMNTSIEYIKQQNYNDALYDFDQAVSAYRHHTIQLDSFLATCFSIVDADKNDTLYRFYTLLKRQKKINFAMLEFQIKLLAQYIIENADPYYARKAISIVTLSAKNNQRYIQLLNLAKQCVSERIERYTTLIQYKQLIDQFNKFSADKINDLINTHIDKCYTALIHSDTEQNIYNASTIFSLFNHLLTLTLSRKEYNALFNTDKPLQSILDKSFASIIKIDPSFDSLYTNLKSFIPTATAFYRTTCNRDCVLARNIIDSMSDTDSAIVICGGFHTDYILKSLRNNNISYSVIRPITYGTFDFSLYASAVLRSNLSLIPDGAGLNLRASSFFAQNSLDSPETVESFQLNFVFTAIIDAVDDFSITQLRSIVTRWRSSFAQSISAYYDTPSAVNNAMAVFDKLVTNLLLSEKTIINSINQSIDVFYNGYVYHLQKDPSGLGRITRHNVNAHVASTALLPTQHTTALLHLTDKPPKQYSASTKTEATRLLDSFFLDPSVVFNQPKGQNQFIETYIYPFFDEYASRKMSDSQTFSSFNDIKESLTDILDLILKQYQTRLSKLHFEQADTASESMRNMLRTVADNIRIASPADFFIPSTGNRYIHFILNTNSFHPDKTKRAITTIDKLYIPANRLEDTINDIHDIESIERILSIPSMIDFDTIFTRWNNPNSFNAGGDYLGYIPTYTGSKLQQKELIRTTATIVLDQFRNLLHTYTPLFKQYGYDNPDMNDLLSYLEKIYTSSDAVELQSDQFLHDFTNIIQRIMTFHKRGKTEFFRGERQWRFALEQYLADIVLIKTVSNDRSLTVSSIGSSYGKEAYSIALIIDKSLHTFAQKHLFTNISDKQIRGKKIDEWINSWQITIHAYELDIQKLVSLLEGVYTITDYDYSDFIINEILPEYNHFITDQVLVKSNTQNKNSTSPVTIKEYQIQVPTRYKLWIKPHYFDFTAQNAKEQVATAPAEIIFGLNFLPYINSKGDPTPLTVAPNQVVEQFRSLLNSSRTQKYKVLGIYNRKFQESPESFNLIPDQPYVLPSPTIPNIITIQKLSHYNPIKSAQDIAGIFGISNKLSEQIYTVYSALQSAINSISRTDDLNKQDVLTDTISSRIISFLNDSAPALLSIGYTPAMLKKQITDLHHTLSSVIRKSINTTPNAQPLTANFSNDRLQTILTAIDALFSNVTPLSNTALIIPDKSASYTHYYIDIPSYSSENTNVQVRYSIPLNNIKTLKHNTASQPAVITLMDAVGFDPIKSYPALIHNAGAIYSLFKTPLESIATHHNKTLLKLYGSASIDTLAQYVADKTTTKTTEQSAIIAQLRTVFFSKQTANPDPLPFFDNANSWQSALQSTLNSIIELKTYANDKTLTIRILDSQTGKTAFSIGSIIVQSLTNYAKHTLFADIPAGTARDSAITRWIDTWDIRIVMNSDNTTALYSALNGRYILSADEAEFFKNHPELKSIFTQYIQTENGSVNTITAPLLRRWITPYYTLNSIKSFNDTIALIIQSVSARFAVNKDVLQFVSNAYFYLSILSKTSRPNRFIPNPSILNEQQQTEQIVNGLKHDKQYASVELPPDKVLAQILRTIRKQKIHHPYEYLADYSGEFTIIANPIFGKQQYRNLIAFAKQTSSAQYRGLFFAQAMPVSYTPVPIQPYTLNVFALNYLIKAQKLTSPNDIDSITGIPISMPQITQRYNLISSALTNAFNDIYNKHELDFDTPQFQDKLLDIIFSDTIPSITKALSASLDTSELNLRQLIPAIAQLASVTYMDNLQSTDTLNPLLNAESFHGKIKDKIDKIKYAGIFDAFIPQPDNSFVHIAVYPSYLKPVMDLMITKLLNKYYSIEWTPPNKTPAYISVTHISSLDKERLYNYALSVAQLRAILEKHQVHKQFSFFPFEFMPTEYLRSKSMSIAFGEYNRSKLIPSIGIGTEHNKANLYNRLSEILMPYFQFILTDSMRQSMPNPEPLAKKLSAPQTQKTITSQIKSLPFADTEIDYTSNITDFFRNNKQWQQPFKKYLTDIIRQKTALGDYTLSAKSIGSSTGKESYTIASLIYTELQTYASTYIFAHIDNKQQKDKNIEQWIASWDISIYALDHSMQRLISSDEGVFLLEQSEMTFFKEHPQYARIFASLTQPDPDKTVAYGVIRNEIKNWIHPVYTDIEAHPEMLDMFPTEISVSLNFINYINIKPDTFIKFITSSNNPSYKSLILFNTDFSEPPIAFNRIEAEPFTIPPAKTPNYATIHSIASALSISTETQLANLMGLTQQQTNMVHLYFQILPYAQTVITAISPISSQSNILQQDLSDLINTNISAEIPKMLIGLAKNNASANTIREAFTAFTQIIKHDLNEQFHNHIRSNRLPIILSRISNIIDQQLSGIDIINSHTIFVPATIFGHHVYIQYYIDSNAFSLNPKSIGIPTVRSSIITENRKQIITGQFEQMRDIDGLLSFIDWKKMFNIWSKRRSILPNYTSAPAQIAQLRKMLIRLIIPYAHTLADNYSDELIKIYGSATLKTLTKYAKSLRSNPHTGTPHPLIADLDQLKDQLARNYITQQKTDTAWQYGIYTAFFREAEGWEPYLRSYIDDLILQKIAMDDFTISARSIGASIGKESYSIAELIEQRLKHYAETKLFARITTEQERQQAVDKWIGLWDVRIYAMEFVYQRLVTAQVGVYGFAGEDAYFNSHPEYMPMFSEHGATADNIPLVQINHRLKQWIIPIQLDLNSTQQPIIDHPAEITFMMNIREYLKDTQPIDKAIYASFNPRYKSYYAYNQQFFSYPNRHSVLKNQPYTIAPSIIPTKDILERFARIHNIYRIEDLTKIFGLTPDDMTGITQPAQRKQLPNRNIHLIDSML